MVLEMESSVASLNARGEEIKPYKIHVSSKYLELTQKKLELTRLPHELLLPKVREWEHGTPKSEVEPLIDFWLEEYSWRNQETNFNTTLPQFRTAIQRSEGGIPLRIHFVHVRSPYPYAIPLLLIPPFPLTNLSLSKLIEPLSNPEDPASTQPFHLVIPSIPGLGFSDAFTALEGQDARLRQTADVFNSLMLRLGYAGYIASATGGGRESPAGIDYHLVRLVGDTWNENCLGVHLINPLLQRPRLREDPLSWMKLSVAKFFHAPIFGYEAADFTALRESEKARKARKAAEIVSKRMSSLGTSVCSAVGTLGLREPNTLAYALCDSPVGLLSLVCSTLRRASPSHGLKETEIIDLTHMAWLPGPEAGMRLWAGAVSEIEGFSSAKRSVKSRAAVTVFGSNGEEGYTCPAWASTKHDVVFIQRVAGKPGLVALEKMDVVVEGIRGLAKEVEKIDDRLRARPLEQVVTDQDPVDETIVEEDEVDDAESVLGDVESPDTIVAVQR